MMDIKEDLVKLYNTLITIETKGDNTKTMADCLRYLEQLVKKQDEESKQVENELKE